MQISRNELYERVSTSPLSKLAAEFGISGTALAALCKKHQVPYPGSGYWTRKSLGIEAELPVLQEAPDEVVEITPVTSKPRQPKTPKNRPTKDKAPKNARRMEHHPLLFGVEGHLRKSREVKDCEFLRPYKRLLPDLISSEVALPRALRIANALYLALDEKVTAFTSPRKAIVALPLNTGLVHQ